MNGKLSYIAVLAIATLLPCLLALRRPLRALPSCADQLAEFQKLRGGHVVPSSPSDAFIFFLHVPRTAGKTYATCFLRAAMPPTKRCAPSYDFLRYNTSQEGCRYITSHDDYSLTSVSWLRLATTAVSIKLTCSTLRLTPCKTLFCRCDHIINQSLFFASLIQYTSILLFNICWTITNQRLFPPSSPSPHVY
jgi:hypothetical protein